MDIWELAMQFLSGKCSRNHFLMRFSDLSRNCHKCDDSGRINLIRSIEAVWVMGLAHPLPPREFKSALAARLNYTETPHGPLLYLIS